MNDLKLTARHLKTCYRDDLQSHHYGINTLLISASTVDDYDESVWDIIFCLLADCNGYNAADLPFTSIELETAISECINELHRSYYISNVEFTDCKVYVLLDWNNYDDN